MSFAQEPGARNPEPPPHEAAFPSSLGRIHTRRLRDVYRSAGWPCCDAVEMELLAAGLLVRVRSVAGHETLRVTDAGLAHVAQALATNRRVRTKHEALLQKVAREMMRSGRIVWRELSLRAQLPAAGPVGKARWRIARPDLFSIRNTSVEAYAAPVVHEIKVSRSDLLSDLRKSDKRAAYLDLGGECWYVLGRDARGRPIGDACDVPPECGVLIEDGERFVVARAALHRSLPRLPFSVWIALAKATPLAGFDEDAQGLLDEAQR